MDIKSKKPSSAKIGIKSKKIDNNIEDKETNIDFNNNKIYPEFDDFWI